MTDIMTTGTWDMERPAVPRCRSCKHWESGARGWSEDAPDGWGECSRFDYPVDPYTGQYFMTAPDFGCVGHEPRE